MIKRLLWVLVCILLLVNLCLPVLAVKNEEAAPEPEPVETVTVILITSPESFLKFAENCRLDSYSKNLQVELAAICRKAMAFDRQKRYDSVGELLRDLHKYLDGKPVSAYSPLTLLSALTHRYTTIATIIATAIKPPTKPAPKISLLKNKKSSVNKSIIT